MDTIIRSILVLAGIYNLFFAVWLSYDPGALFDQFRLANPIPEMFITPLSISIAAFAMLYFYAFLFPKKARVLIGLGLVAKVVPTFLIIGLIFYADWPVGIFKMVAVNDWVWWVPLGWVVWRVRG